MRETMTPTEALAALRAVHERTTQGVWYASTTVAGLHCVDAPEHAGDDYVPIADTHQGANDAAGIALAHNTMAALLDVVEAAQRWYALGGCEYFTRAVDRLVAVVAEEVSHGE